MAVYFSGRRRIGEFTRFFDAESTKFDVVIYERWEDIDISSIARCGDPGYCEVEKSEGFSDKSFHSLKGVIEGTLGVEGLASLKSQIEEVIGKEMQWNKGVRVTKRFEHSSPKCGRKVITIYELRREFEITCSRLRRLTFKKDKWDKKWTRTLVYETNKHDAYPDITEYDELCDCKDPKFIEHDGRLCFDLGNISFRVPYRLKEGGFNVQIFDTVVSFAFNESSAVVRALSEGVDIVIPTDVLPDVVKFLGEIEGSSIEARVFKFLEADELEIQPVEMVAAEVFEQEVITQIQTQFLEE